MNQAVTDLEYKKFDTDGNVKVSIQGAAASDGLTDTELRASPVDVTESTKTDRSKVMEADDCAASYAWSDFGLSTERVSSITYTSATVGMTATKTFNYTLVGTSYRLDGVTWTVS